MKTLRCAVYTRKSSEEGLELSFNSLHAQREACEAYVLSQAGEGWSCLARAYDDGGISGGHMERPGLKALIEDIKNGQVDIIVVYKVDRLTRSLTDFSKLVEVFDAHGVSFVSVTQAFNTTNSMGRLTLNVLLSFAQFEREVTGERIRDKIAMSRKRGLWTGGLPPLGYDAIDKKLVINEVEAEQVRHIYTRYAELKNVRQLKAELDNGGYVSKRRVTKTGRASGGKPFERGALYAILKNKTYLGLTLHKGEAFEGEHQSIIEKELFESVIAVMALNRQRNTHKTGSKSPSLLAGKITSPSGITLTPSHAQKAGKRYRYYVERRRDKAIHQSHVSRPVRLPATEIEASVMGKLVNYLSCPIRLIDDLGLSKASQDRQAAISGKAVAIAQRLTDKSCEQGLSRDLISKVELHPDITGYDLTIDLAALATLLELQETPEVNTASLTVNLQLKVCNNGKTVIIGGAPAMAPSPNAVLIQALRLGHDIKGKFMGESPMPVSKIACQMDMDARHVWRTLKLAFLAPDIQLAILSGTQPRGLILKDLTAGSLPMDWKSQRAELGFTA